jgi:AraC-like DNA-binding protein
VKTTPSAEEPTGNGREPITRWMPFDGGVALDSNEDPKPWKVLHMQYTIAVIRHGAADWTYRKRNFSVTPGSVYVCEPGEVHRTTRVECPGDFTAFFLDQETLPLVGEQLGVTRDLHFATAGVMRPDLWQLFSHFRTHLTSSDAESCAQIMSRLLVSLVQHSDDPLLTRSSRTRFPEATLQRARRHLADTFYADPGQTVRLQNIADDLGVGYHALIHEFSKRFGVAPYEYVDALRAYHAFLTIQRGPTAAYGSLAAAAIACGYSDASHMARKFKKHWGLSPSAFAHQVNPKWFVRVKSR